MAEKDEKKDKEKVDEVITAVYKVNLHCPQCARKIRRPLLRTQGVQSVEIDIEKSEIKVKGTIDVTKIHKLIESLSKKKVELISPQVKKKESDDAAEKKPKETKEPIIRSTTVKVYMHCDKCEHDLRKRLLKHKGIYTVKTEFKAQTVTVQGTIEPEKLVSHLRKKMHKHAEIVASKPEKKEEKKEKENVEKEEEKVEAKSTETTKIIEFKEEVKVEVKSKESDVPYFIHYVYAPQLFSDENPNACSIM